MKTCPEAPGSLIRTPAIVVTERERHVQRVLGIGDESDQRAVAGILDPVVARLQRREIAAQYTGESGLGCVLIGRGSFREADEIGEQKARHDRANRRTWLGFDHCARSLTEKASAARAAWHCCARSAGSRPRFVAA